MGREKNIVGIYVRLSDEDKNKAANKDSESIQNQKNMLIEYAMKNCWKIYDIYSDDDYSGADEAIERPEFKRLMQDAEAGKIDIVLAKSQSRFTRDMEYVEHILHNKFVQWQIRFIGITDNADTDVKGNKKSRQINGLVNEWYVEDLSENIRAAFDIKRKMGQFTGAFAAYGYLKDPENKNHLIIDPFAAPVVAEIYKMYLSGHGLERIAKKMNESGIPCPGEYKRLQGLNFVSSTDRKVWRSSSVYTILKNPIYTGDMVQGRYTTVSYKNSKHIRKNENEWVTVHNTHTAIISKEEFELIAKMGKQRIRPENGGKRHIFAGKIFCGECGSTLIKHHGDKINKYFICSMKKYGTCPNGVSVSYKILYDEVFDKIREIIKNYSSEEALSGMFKSEKSAEGKQYQLKQLQESLIKQSNDVTLTLENLYIDKVKGVVTEAQFIMLSRKLSERQTELEHQIKQSQTEIDQCAKRSDFTDEKNKIIHKYVDIKELTQEIVNEFVESISVKNSPVPRKKEITIKWKI